MKQEATSVNSVSAQSALPPADAGFAHGKVRDQITDPTTSALRRYQRVIIGSGSLSQTLKFEMICWLSSILPGALGLWARPRLYRRLFKRVGRGTVFGANCAIRHPGKIELGENVVISDGCTLDARGDDNQGIRIGDSTIVGLRAMIRCKNADVVIGRNVGVGANSDVCSVNGSPIIIGDDVMLGPYVFLGGVQYRYDRLDLPISAQGIVSKGGIVIGEGAALGAFVTVMDGVKIGKGCMIGAGVVLREDVPDLMVVMPHQRLVSVKRQAH